QAPAVVCRRQVGRGAVRLGGVRSYLSDAHILPAGHIEPGEHAEGLPPQLPRTSMLAECAADIGDTVEGAGNVRLLPERAGQLEGDREGGERPLRVADGQVGPAQPQVRFELRVAPTFGAGQ